jgi:multidrug efflux pump subunit AcrB
MIYMTSTATNSGSATISIYFKQGTNSDMAAVNVQNRVAKAQNLLPAEVTRVGGYRIAGAYGLLVVYPEKEIGFELKRKRLSQILRQPLCYTKG